MSKPVEERWESYRGRRLRYGTFLHDGKQWPYRHIHDLSPSCPFLSVEDDNGEKLRGAAHALEAGKTIIDVVDKYRWGFDGK